MNLGTESQHRRRRTLSGPSLHSVRSCLGRSIASSQHSTRSSRSTATAVSPTKSPDRKSERLLALGKSSADLLSFSNFMDGDNDDDDTDDFSSFHNSPQRTSPQSLSSSVSREDARCNISYLPMNFQNKSNTESDISAMLLSLPEEGKCSPLAQRTSTYSPDLKKNNHSHLAKKTELLRKVSKPSVYRQSPQRSSSADDGGMRPAPRRRTPPRSASDDGMRMRPRAPARTFSTETSSTTSSNLNDSNSSLLNNSANQILPTVTSPVKKRRPRRTTDTAPPAVITTSPVPRQPVRRAPTREIPSRLSASRVTPATMVSRSLRPEVTSSRRAPPRTQSLRDPTPPRRVPLSRSSSHSLQWDRKNVEVMPGYFLPLCGGQESIAAYHLGAVLEVSCLDCDTFLYCIDTASMVLCPQCRCFSPVPGTKQQLGLGLTLELLQEELQSHR